MRQHCDIRPKSVSHILLISPEKKNTKISTCLELQISENFHKLNQVEGVKSVPYKEPLLSGKMASNSSNSFPFSLVTDA